MDTQFSDNQDDLSNVEHRLSAWRPQAEGLNADAMLFAAGRASGHRPPSRLWMALVAVLIMQAVGLGAWGISERSGRLALSSQLADRASSPVETRQIEQDGAWRRSYVPAPNDYLHQRKRMEQDAGFYVAAASPGRNQGLGQKIPQAAILSAGQWSELLD